MYHLAYSELTQISFDVFQQYDINPLMTATLKEKNEQICFHLKSARISCMTMELFKLSHKNIEKQLSVLFNQAPQFFSYTPVILSLEKYEKSVSCQQVLSLIKLCASHGIVLFAFRGGNETTVKSAVKAGLFPLPKNTDVPIVNDSTAKIIKTKKDSVVVSANQDIQNRKNINAPTDLKLLSEVSVERKKIVKNEIDKQLYKAKKNKYVSVIGTKQPTEASSHEEINQKNAAKARIIMHPVRSGQQVFHAGELIVLGPVSAGAELVSESNIHVYNVMRGRAFAGVNGNDDARIFCSCFQSELVSINGNYKISSDISSNLIGRNVQVWFEAGCIKIALLPSKHVNS